MLGESEVQPAGPATELDDAEDESRHLARWVLIALVLGLGAAWLLAFNAVPTLQDVVDGHAAIVAFVEDHIVVSVVALALLHIVVAVFSIPAGSILTITSGAVFGGVLGGAVTVVAATIGSLIFYVVVRAAFSDWMRARLARSGAGVRAFTTGFRSNAFAAIIIMRLVPLVPYWVANGLPALFDVKPRVFVPAAFIGLFPWTFGFAFFGEALGDLIAAQDVDALCAVEACEIDYSALTSGPVVTALALGGLAMLPIAINWVINRWRWARATAI